MIILSLYHQHWPHILMFSPQRADAVCTSSPWGLGSEHRHCQQDGPWGLALLSLLVMLPKMKSWGREGRWTSPRVPRMCCYSTPHMLPAMAQLLFVSVMGLGSKHYKWILLTAWLPHHSFLSSWNFGLVSWLAASACVQLMYFWAQDHVNQKAQSSFRWAAEVKHQQTLGEEKLPGCLVGILHSCKYFAIFCEKKKIAKNLSSSHALIYY